LFLLKYFALVIPYQHPTNSTSPCRQCYSVTDIHPSDSTQALAVWNEPQEMHGRAQCMVAGGRSVRDTWADAGALADTLIVFQAFIPSPPASCLHFATGHQIDPAVTAEDKGNQFMAMMMTDVAFPRCERKSAKSDYTCTVPAQPCLRVFCNGMKNAACREWFSKRIVDEIDSQLSGLGKDARQELYNVFTSSGAIEPPGIDILKVLMPPNKTTGDYFVWSQCEAATSPCAIQDAALANKSSAAAHMYNCVQDPNGRSDLDDAGTGGGGAVAGNGTNATRAHHQGRKAPFKISDDMREVLVVLAVTFVLGLIPVVDVMGSVRQHRTADNMPDTPQNIALPELGPTRTGLGDSTSAAGTSSTTSSTTSNDAAALATSMAARERGSKRCLKIILVLIDMISGVILYLVACKVAPPSPHPHARAYNALSHAHRKCLVPNTFTHSRRSLAHLNRANTRRLSTI
jgi:hypothetical protein